MVYLMGKRVPDVTQDPILQICIKWMAMDYVMQQDPKYQDLVTDLNEQGERVSFVFKAQKTRDDLMRLREIVKLWGRVCFGKPSGAKFVGKDGLNAVTVVAPRVDRAMGTHYADNVESYRRFLQENDASLALAMTDVKGDRSLAPSKQKPHQDYYVHIVEERKDGIVVRGAKAHISEAPLSNELIVVPCRAMKEDDKDYAVSFGVPANAKGLSFISAEPEMKEPGNFFDYPLSASVYINDAMVIFDDVFIPNERIFLKGEWKFAGHIAHMFGNFHRLSAETYKAVELELLAGAAALMAEYNNVEHVAHIREKLTWLANYAEATEVLGRAACEHCALETESGLVYPNPMIANIAKLYFADNWHQGTKYLQDIAGGIVATAPAAADYYNPETHDYIEKYLGGKEGIPTEHRLRLIKFIRDLGSSYEDVITLHAEGSLAAQRLSIHALAEFDRYKAAAKRAARINDGSHDPIYSQLPEFPPAI
ncbi:MAG: 4-hydroxybutyryl-CoA dehydratase [Proteobacteria bacterium]|nr:4-hydroxybutyryl-CoA dehydratase [Pseudomonadota bacterium]